MSTYDLILIGGGHAHIQVIKSWAMAPDHHWRVTLISDVGMAPYSGMLPGALAGWYPADEIGFDLVQTCQRAGVRLIVGKVEGVDLQRQKVLISGRASMDYDLLSINVGGLPEVPPGFAGLSQVVPLKPVSQLLSAWHSYLQHWKNNSHLQTTIVGGGAAGVEVAVAAALQRQSLGLKGSIRLLEQADRILPAMPERASRVMGQCLAKLGVDVSVGLGEGLESTDWTWVATSVRAPEWLRTSGLPVNKNGFVLVDQYLQVKGMKQIFAAGDCIDFCGRNLPKAGVYAVREGPVLLHNLRLNQSLSVDLSLRAYHPQQNFLTLMTSGEKRAMAVRGSFVSEGPWWWTLKDLIDRRFMKNFSLPLMAETMTSPEAADNTCGGCGGKIGSELLASVLKELEVGPVDDAFVWSEQNRAWATTIDGFRRFCSDDFLFAEVAVHHAMNDMAAMNVRPKLANVFVTMATQSIRFRQRTLLQIMKGIEQALKIWGAKLGNGHTAEGHEDIVALSILGDTELKQTVWRKQGLRPGDQLVLTKPLGTGILLQAWMRGIISANSLTELLTNLRMSHANLFGKLNEFNISSATDISGFGLVGHLQEMLSGSLKLQLLIEKIPVLPGVRESLQQGVVSALADENAKAYALASFVKPEWIDQPKMFGFLWDPQTNGPLLLVVAEPQLATLLAQLQSMGYKDATHIGCVLG